MPINIPNLLTWLRIILIPLFFAAFYLPTALLHPHAANVLGTGIFAVAAVTDWLDGYLARTLNQMSAFGAFLDPVADKLMVAAALIVLVDKGRVAAAIALIIIGREIAISALREWMAHIGEARSVAVAFAGKLKTASQMAAILLLLYHDAVGPFPTRRLGTWLIWLAALLTLWSMAHYVRMALPRANRRDHERSP